MEAFMVRVWTPEGDDDWSPGVRGTATHLASGEEVTFAEAAALIAFITRVISSPDRQAMGDAQHRDSSKGHVRL
jgi:hypothetical protein